MELARRVARGLMAGELVGSNRLYDNILYILYRYIFESVCVHVLHKSLCVRIGVGVLMMDCMMMDCVMLQATVLPLQRSIPNVKPTCVFGEVELTGCNSQ